MVDDCNVASHCNMRNLQTCVLKLQKATGHSKGSISNIRKEAAKHHTSENDNQLQV